MQNPPDYLTATEEKELANLIELQIDTAIEEKHLSEVDVEPPIDSDGI